MCKFLNVLAAPVQITSVVEILVIVIVVGVVGTYWHLEP